MQKSDRLRNVLRVLVSLVLLHCTTAHGQIITSTILGHVTDSSGAVIPGAEVAVTNQGTAITSKTVTDSVGLYSVSGLPAGVYAVVVTQKGFETSQVTGIQLLSAQTERADVTLKLGASVQVVTVTGEKAGMVHTDSIGVGTMFNNQQISELPLYADTIDSVDRLVPGFQWSQSQSNARINGGQYWGSINYTLNGAFAGDIANGGSAYAYSANNIVDPQPESFQELTVNSMNNNAEYARTATVTMVTKAGSNHFHGDINELNANAIYNANAFTNNANGGTGIFKRPGYVRNQMGINIGGPIWRDKAFFFLNGSEYLDRSYTPENLVQPSTAMHLGNFGAVCTGITGASFNGSGICSSAAGQLYNPQTGAPFAANVIPASMFTSQANVLLGFLPNPDVTSAGALGLPNGITNNVSLNRTAHDVDTTNDRLDYKLTEKDLLYGTYMRSNSTVYLVAAAAPADYDQIVYPPTNTTYTLSENHTFGPTALNEFRWAWSDRTVTEVGQNLGFNPQTLFPGLTPGTNRGLPTMTMTGYTGMFADVGNNPREHSPTVEFTDNFTKVHGRHTFKFGGDEMGAKIYGKHGPGSLGTFAFNGQWTAGKGWSNSGVTPSAGNAFADFLLGDAQSTSDFLPGTFGRAMYDRFFAFYAEDTWQVTSHLTIYYGLRYELQKPWWTQIDGGVGLNTYFNPSTDQIALPENSSTPFFPPVDASQTEYNAYLAETTTTQALGMPIRWAIPDSNNFGPRFGFAYRPFHSNDTVIRAGYGVYYDEIPGFAGNYDMSTNTPWLLAANNQGVTYSSALPGSPPVTGYQPDVTFANPFPTTLGNGVAAATHPTISYTDRKFLNPVVQQWNVTLEHQFAGQWMGRVTYFGDQTHHGMIDGANINIPSTMTAGASLQSQLPYQPWAAVSGYRSAGKQNLDELQVEMIKRVGGGLTLQSYYTYMHSLDNIDSSTQTPVDWHNANADYGNTQFVRRNMFNIAYMYQLPFGQGKHFLGSAHGALNALVGGWELSGDTIYGSGVPYTVDFAVPTSTVGWFGYNTSPVVYNRANLLTGTPVYQGQQKGSHNVIAGVPWYNVNAFAPPTPYTWGDSSRNAYFGPGWENWDMSLLKNFMLPWRDGLRLQIRLEALNAFNHYNLGNPGVQSSSYDYSPIADTRDGGPANPTQGLITGCLPNCPVGPYGQGNRYLQVGAKLYF